jgi:DNA-binding GntR family transcriptional regulator
MDAINQGKPEEADRAMRRHIRYGLDTIVNMIGPRANNTVRRIK